MKSIIIRLANLKYMTSVKLTIFAISVSFAVYGCSFLGIKQNHTIELTHFERLVAQKMILDIRFFCKDIADPKLCKTPVTSLPPELAQMIKETSIGGVVLFSQNITSPQQVLELTQNLQTAAHASDHGNGLFIAVDQEGGQVVRLPRKDATSFAGNMAIGATYKKFGTRYASDVGQIIGSELSQLGINLNFSPDVDVNINPNNPIINIRSFGKNPKVVGELGIAMMNGLQQNQVIATLKHFPGHGNTSVDSHTGLPRVNYDQQMIAKNDIEPFKMAIEAANPGMIMTAHIQYPQLDSSNIISIKGNSIVRPATMSKKILTGLLRKQLKYRGVVITDALDMKSISDNFDPLVATFEAFRAGADIALMPFTIRNQSDIVHFKQFIRLISAQLESNEKLNKLIHQSTRRISELKHKFKIDTKAIVDLKDAQLKIGTVKSRNIEWQLAVHSVTSLKTDDQNLPLGRDGANKIHLVAESEQQIALFSKAIHHYWPLRNEQSLQLSYSLISDWQFPQELKELDLADDLIVLFKGEGQLAVNKAERKKSTENKNNTHFQRKNSEVKNLLKYATENKIHSVLVAIKSPYAVRNMVDEATSTLFTYDPNIYKNRMSGQDVGASYDAVAALIVGVNKFSGELPVSLFAGESFDLEKNKNLTAKLFPTKIKSIQKGSQPAE